MRDKLCVRVRLAALGKDFEFRIPYSLRVGEVARLMAHILALREEPLFEEPPGVRLMLLEGEHAGELLDNESLVEAYVAQDVLLAGTVLALV
ncbi:MAG: hypothetical protein Q4B54_02230 [Coriobacteriales bacterium]|nr:hypothetical protein [Coriobacteriales bacterium]